eukprot:639427-Amphidinium_carterae.1
MELFVSQVFMTMPGSGGGVDFSPLFGDVTVGGWYKSVMGSRACLVCVACVSSVVCGGAMS